MRALKRVLIILIAAMIVVGGTWLTFQADSQLTLGRGRGNALSSAGQQLPPVGGALRGALGAPDRMFTFLNGLRGRGGRLAALAGLARNLGLIGAMFLAVMAGSLIVDRLRRWRPRRKTTPF